MAKKSLNRIAGVHEITCGPEMFESSLEALLGNIPELCGEGLEKAVRKSTTKTAKRLRSGDFGNAGKHAWSGEYMSGFSSAMTRSGMTPEGEVGNKNKPGLVHLLEKGHVTLTSRRTQAYPHMAPAFESMAEGFVDEAKRGVMEALQ